MRTDLRYVCCLLITQALSWGGVERESNVSEAIFAAPPLAVIQSDVPLGGVSRPQQGSLRNRRRRERLRADTVGAFDVSAGYVVLSLDNNAEGSRRRFHFGESYPSSSLASPVAGDFDGDGQDSLGFFNYREGRFYLANSNVPGVVDRLVTFFPPGHGPSADGRGWIPIAGDWTAAGFDQLALYDWRTSTFYFLDFEGQVVSTLQFGTPRPSPDNDQWPGGPYPLAGDWDGDGIDTIGVCYLGPDGGPNLFELKNSLSEEAPDLTLEFGPVRGYPIAGDWDRDGIDTIGLFDPKTKTFYLTNSHQSGAADHTFVLNEGPLFECLVCNRLPPATIPGSSPWQARGAPGAMPRPRPVTTGRSILLRSMVWVLPNLKLPKRRAGTWAICAVSWWCVTVFWFPSRTSRAMTPPSPRTSNPSPRAYCLHSLELPSTTDFSLVQAQTRFSI